MKMKKLLVALLTLTLLAATMIGYTSVATASTNTVVFAEYVNVVLEPGQTVHYKLPIMSTGAYIYCTDLELSGADGAPFTVSNLMMTMSDKPTQVIANAKSTFLEFDIQVKATAGIKSYPISFKFSFKETEEGSIETSVLKTQFSILEEKQPAQLSISGVTLSDTRIGKDSVLTLTVRNDGVLTAKNVFLTINYGDIMTENYSAKSIKIGDLGEGQSQAVNLPVTILPTAPAGRKVLAATFTYKTVDGDAATSTYNIPITLKVDEEAPKIKITQVDVKDGLEAEESFAIKLTLKNTGIKLADKVLVAVDATSITKDGIIKNYITDNIEVMDIKHNSSQTVEIPLKVSKYATTGLKEVKLNITYADEAGVAYTLTNTVYVDVVSEGTDTKTASIVISNVKQSPAKPVAGQKMEVSFTVENKGETVIKDLKLFTDGLTGTTFIPVEAEPYQYFEKLEVGKKIQITIPFKVSNSISEGMNNLTVKYSYSGLSADGSVTIPVRDVVNDLGSKSKPKLIVSKYMADQEELRAGSTFNFTFDIHNTHSSIAAKNITVTISQADNIFTVAQGSNSFFINKIAAGETATNSVQMKVKSDASTKAYPIKLTIEYEYDGMEPNPETGAVGETKTVELNLQAMENSRPVVDYVNVNSWEGMVTVGNTATLSFEFYNMGRSPLNNVIATVEGDITKADGNMFFIGNVAEGSSSFVEFDVIPNIEGKAKGTLKITFEDSNGDQIDFTKEFETEVMPAAVIDPGMIGGDSGEVFNPEVIPVKKPILPIWLFVLIEVVIFIVFMSITRKIIISRYKVKLRRKEQEQY